MNHVSLRLDEHRLLIYGADLVTSLIPGDLHLSIVYLTPFSPVVCLNIYM